MDGMDTADPTAPLDQLRASLPADVVETRPDSMEAFRRDWSRDAGAGMPLAVVRPRDAGEVQATVRWAAEHRVPVVPRGAGSGLSGGASAVGGGLVLSLDRMRAIDVDVATQVAYVEPGALNAEVKAAAAEQGLWYAPDPASYAISSIGGNVATNAGGLCCVKYGVTADYVLGMDVVLADGRLVTLGGPRIKDVAGLSLVQLFVGSEGMLGVITRVVLRLQPPPPTPATLVATFPTTRSAADAVVAIRSATRPSMLELMDAASVNAVEDHRAMGLDRSAGALLIGRSDAPGAARADEVALMEKACAEAGAVEVFVTEDADEGEMFAEARRAAFPAIETRGSVMLEDVGVPVPLLPDLLTAIADVAERHDLEIPTVAHAGDGNTHPIVVFDAADPASVERAHAAFAEVMAAAIALGGTITGEHGVGRAKKAALPDQLGEDVMDLNRRVKAALDPANILNPGAVL
ncbi:FAD-linked oxidase C-terminal domain-containing protein [Nocardioides lentus]|uniref:FAD-linked oxidase C-terminal domain-containing protein n=2 Tax=Nocardioides lentus TaxID=338077 RepID=A0ABN2PM12_9ACTN